MNLVKNLKDEYIKCIDHRNKTLLKMLHIQAPSFIIKFQMNLLSQSFLMWFIHKILNNIFYKFNFLKMYKSDIINFLPKI